MSEQINPGDGWRLLGPDEPIKAGDEFWRDAIPLFKHEAGWIPTISGFIGLVAHGFKIRRRIPAKPERLVLKEVAVSICHRKKKPETWKVVASIDAAFPGTGYVDAAEARQLADWLTRYADWREAQGESR